MPKKLIKPGILLATVFVVISLLFVSAGATTINVLDVSISDDQNNVKNTNGTITATAKGSLLSKKTNTITITNESGNTATVSFDYTVEKASSFTIDGDAAATSGSFSKLLKAGEFTVFSITSNNGFSNLTVTLTITNLNLVAAAASSNVTIEYDSTLGSVTAGGTAVDSGTTKEVSLADGVALVATSKSGAKFLGWVDEEGKILSSATSYTLTTAADMTVKAAFAKDGGTPWFGVGGTSQKSQSTGLLNLGKLYYYTVSTSYLFDNLNDAATFAAASSAYKTVVLMNSGTLPAGDYTIPAGVTLLIPFDVLNTMYTTQVVNTKGEDWVKPTEYRTLTMADGANLTINGAMSISAKQATARGSKADGGSPTESVSFVKMEGNSSITVSDGGALYAYGFITGSGSVTANSGATVYEMFQFMDFRGGTQSTDMKNGVFPFSQYYVQNIEVPMKLYSGAKEYAYTTIYMSSSDFGTAVNFIGTSGAMFNLTSGYVVKKYDGTTDRMMIEVNGSIDVSAISLQFGTSSIDSEDYDLPINSNITVTAKSGSNVTIKQDLALLPGSVMEIEEGATCTLGSNINVYIYDADQWGNFTFSTGSVNNPFKPLTYAPGRIYNRTNADLVDATIKVNGTLDASKGYLYTTTGGANICSTGTGVVNLKAGTQTSTHQLVQGTKGPDGTTVTSGDVAIPLTSAQLKNADGKYVTPKVTDTFTYTNGKWVCTVHTLDGAADATATNGATYSLNCGTGCGECLASVTVAYRLRDYLWLNATVTNNFADRGVTFAMDGAQTVGSYVIRSVSAAEISNSLSLTFTYNSVSCSLEMNLARYKEMITDDEDIALINTLLAYGEAAEDSFAGNANEKPAGVTRPGGLPGELIVFEEQAGSVSSGSQASNVTVSRYGMTIGFGNCLQFIYGFRVNDAAGITDWSNIVEIGLLYSDVAGTLEAKKENFAYVLYQNPALVKDSENLPQGVVPTPKPTDTTLSQDELKSMWSTNGIYMIAYNMAYEDYGKSYNYRPYILYADGSVAYGEQFAYSLTTYIGNRLNSTANAPSDTEKTLLYATWNLKEAVATWLSAKESAT